MAAAVAVIRSVSGRRSREWGTYQAARCRLQRQRWALKIGACGRVSPVASVPVSAVWVIATVSIGCSFGGGGGARWRGRPAGCRSGLGGVALAAVGFGGALGLHTDLVV